MKKLAIILIYFILFWIILPFVLYKLGNISDNYVFRGMTLPDICSVAGLIILIPSFSILLLSVCQFRIYSREFPVSATPPQNIIQKGVFSIWRHPIYLFAILTFLGIALFIKSYGLLFIVLPVFILGVAFYIINEEKVLLKRFGTEYKNYRIRTCLLIPRLHIWFKALVFPFFKIWTGIRIYNKSNIQANPPFFVVASHRNYLDPFLISWALPWPVRYISTFEMFRTKSRRKIFATLGAIPKKRYATDTRSVMLMKKALDLGYPVGIFPSGERSWTGITQTFKQGTLQMFRKFTHIPILPVRIEGNYYMWPRWSPRMLRSKVKISFEEMINVTNDIDNEKLEEMIIERITPAERAEKQLRCKSKNLTGRLSRLLYRCPSCRENEILYEIPPDILKCRKCGMILKIDNQFNLHFIMDGKEYLVSIDQVYNDIKIKHNDLTQCGINILNSDELCRLDNETPLYRSVCVLQIEQNDKFVLLGRGIIYLTENAVWIFYSGSTVHIDLESIGAVTIESYYRLQLYIPREKKLFQIILESESVVKWQDTIVLLMNKAGLTKLITR